MRYTFLIVINFRHAVKKAISLFILFVFSLSIHAQTPGGAELDAGHKALQAAQYKQAFNWYKKAADLGDEAAKNILKNEDFLDGCR